MPENLCNESTSLICRSLNCFYDDRPIFSNLSFSVSPGSLTQIKGSNGAGKSTLLRMLVGLRRPDKGEIEWQGHAWCSGWNNHFITPFFLDHHLSAHEQLTPRENLLAWLTLHATRKISDIDNVVLHALQQAGLSVVIDEPLRQLSFGQKRRAVLARLLITTNKWWFLDEPFNGLDQNAQAWLSNLIDLHVQQGGSVILTSHTALAVQTSIQMIDLGQYRQNQE